MNASLIKTFLKGSGLVKGPEQMAAVDKLFSIKWEAPKSPVSMDYTETAMRMAERENVMLVGLLDGGPVTIFIQSERGAMPDALVKMLTGGK